MSQAGIASLEKAHPEIPTSFVTDSGTAIPIANIIEILGGAGVSTSGASNIVTITVSASGFTWNTITSATNPNSLSIENGYITKGAGAVVMVLPPASNVGDTIEILGYGNLWQLTQNAGQTIFFGSQQTTPGVLGSITATMIKDKVTITCVTANTEYSVTSSIGNLTVV